MNVFKKLFFGAVLAGALVGCRTEYPATGDNDRRAVAPETYSTDESKGDTAILDYFKPWWVND